MLQATFDFAVSKLSIYATVNSEQNKSSDLCRLRRTKMNGKS